jgi:hypothetical protein
VASKIILGKRVIQELDMQRNLSMQQSKEVGRHYLGCELHPAKGSSKLFERLSELFAKK